MFDSSGSFRRKVGAPAEDGADSWLLVARRSDVRPAVRKCRFERRSVECKAPGPTARLFLFLMLIFPQDEVTQFLDMPARVLRFRPARRGGRSPAWLSPLSAQRGQHSSSFWILMGHDSLAHRCLRHRDLPSLQWQRMHFISPKGCTVGCHSSPLGNTFI